METKSDDGANSINATSKPRGTYLDPLKACALSGESGINIGKSESATYSKYMNIVRQTRRTASRVSVLNDVERSRLSSVMRRIDGERAYSTAVMDRQKRQFKKSLETLDRQRAGLLRQIDEGVTTPTHLRAKQSLLLMRRQHQLQSVTSARSDRNPRDQTALAPEILPRTAESAEDRVNADGAGATTVTELPAVPSPNPRTPHSQPHRASDGVKPHTVPGDDLERRKGENVPVFFTGLGPERLRDQLCMVHSRKDAKTNKPVAM